MAKSKKALATVEAKDLTSAASEWGDELDQYVKDRKAKTIGGAGSNRLSTRGGVFSIGEDEIGDTIRVIVLNYGIDYAYYPDGFDPKNPVAPDCFALGFEVDNLAPHPDSKDPQHNECKTCWANKFKTAERGNGKACKDSYRFEVVSADDLDEISEDAEVYRLSVPPSSLKVWNKFFSKVENVIRAPLYALAMDITLERLDTGGHSVLPVEDSLAVVPGELKDTILALRDSCKDDILEPYADFDTTEEEEEKPKPTRPARKKTAAKKTATKGGAPRRRTSKF
jgi:hypothetical protein